MISTRWEYQMAGFARSVWKSQTIWCWIHPWPKWRKVSKVERSYLPVSSKSLPALLSSIWSHLLQQRNIFYDDIEIHFQATSRKCNIFRFLDVWMVLLRKVKQKAAAPDTLFNRPARKPHLAPALHKLGKQDLDMKLLMGGARGGDGGLRTRKTFQKDEAALFKSTLSGRKYIWHIQVIPRG